MGVVFHYGILAILAGIIIAARTWLVCPYSNVGQMKRIRRQTVTLSVVALIIITPLSLWWSNATNMRFRSVETQVKELESEFRSVSAEYSELKNEARHHGNELGKIDYTSQFDEFTAELKKIVAKRNKLLKKAGLWQNSSWVCHPDYQVSIAPDPGACDIKTSFMANPFVGGQKETKNTSPKKEVAQSK